MNNTDLRETNKKIAHEFLRLLETMEIKAWADLWAEDGIQEMPYAPKGIPSRLVGKTALYNHYKHLPEMFVSMRFPISNIQTLEDPEWVMVEYTGEIPIKTGGYYNNRYCTLFRIGERKILLAREYFNSLILTDALGGGFNDTFEPEPTAQP